MADNANPMIDLAAGRTIVFRQGANTYTLKLRRGEEKDWFAYFDAIVSTLEQNGREVTRTTDATSAGLELVSALLVSAEGYALPAGVNDLIGVPNWQAKIPMAHRLGALEILIGARAIENDDDAPLTIGGEIVAIESVWSADDAGHMVKHTCRHTFATPSAEHCRRYMRQISRAKVVGGSRSGKTIYSGAQRVLCEIYDELIQGVEGYCFDGQALADPRAIASGMDARHKVAAAASLFASAETEE